MKYTGYSAHIESSEEDRCLVGHIAGITDIVGFMLTPFLNFKRLLRKPWRIIWKRVSD